MLRKHFEMKNKDEYGFTLIELLVVIIIIGILAAIAIPAFLNQRQRANDSAVTSDVRNVAMQIETALVQAPNSAVQTATSTAGGGGTITVNIGSPTASTTGAINLTDGVSIAVAGGSTVGTYTVRGGHSNGKQYTSPAAGTNALVFDSTTGKTAKSTA